MKRISAFLLALLVCFGALAAGTYPVHPQTCLLDSPLGIEKPSFGWQLSSGARGAGQTAWEVEVASSEQKLRAGKADVWKSGKTLSDRQFGILPEGAAFQSAATYWWRVRIWDENGKRSAWTAPACFTMGIQDDGWQAEWITVEWDSCRRMPYLRKEFSLKPGFVKATAYVCGIGAADLFVNGGYADETRILDPAQTNYEQYALYTSLDITSKLKAGANCIGVMLFDGWYNQGTVFADFSYGKPMLRAEVVVEYRSGRTEVIGTDTSWTWKEGPVVASNIYSGETYDARCRIEGWSAPGLEDASWKACVKASKGVPPQMRSQVMPPMRLKESILAKKMWKTSKGKWIFDFGTNNTADIRLTAALPAGTMVTIRTGEEVYEDRDSVDFRSTGISVVPVQTDVFIAGGTGVETWMPRGTYHGFRYAEVTCSDPAVEPSQDWLQAVQVHTDLPVRGHFSCSEEQINRLHEMALRTVSGNIVGVPVDCPTREKCGWLGDSHAYIKMAMDNYDMTNFLYKYLEDIRSTSAREEKNTLHHLLKNIIFYYQDKAPGIPYMIAPGKRLCGVASPDWGTAVVQLPWHLYLYDGDVHALETYYESMAQWTDYITAASVGHLVYTGLGDWDPPYGVHKIATPVELTSSAFHYYDLCIMEQAAAVLGKTADRERYAAERKAVKEAFIAKFYNPVAKTFGTQTGDAMALDLGLCPEGAEKDVAIGISKHMVVQRRFFDTGIFGIGRIGSALSRNGQAELAYSTFMKKGKYSFAWMWDKYDATTLWEVLPVCDGNREETSGCSHCHPMQAGFDIYFYEDLAGIRPLAEAPGFKKVLLEPLWTVALEQAEASIDTRYGTVSSNWKKDGKTIEWNIAVPAGTSASVALPKGMEAIVDGGSVASSFTLEKETADKAYYLFPSGEYRITLN